VRRLDRLISDISNASRLDAELARESAEPVDMGKLAEAMVGIQHDLAATRGVEVVLSAATGKYAPTTVGHDSRLAQVISNLIDNAVSFSPPGGTVTVAVKASEEQIVTTVSDEGPGIRGDVTRIFQRFYTDRPDGEHFGDHSGLGLAISKQIIEAHRGTVTAANRTDRSGARFVVTLPRVAAERAPKARR
jgi:two-component system sensor histidine kinase ChvG